MGDSGGIKARNGPRRGGGDAHLVGVELVALVSHNRPGVQRWRRRNHNAFDP